MARQSIPFERNEIRNWILINLLIGFLVPLTFNPEGYISIEGWKSLWDDILYSFFVSMGISGSVGFTEKKLSYLPWIKYPLKRFVLQFMMISLICFPVVFVINFLFFLAFGAFNLSNIPWNQLVSHTYIPILIGYAITTFFLSRAFLLGWKEAAVDAEKLRAEAYKGQVRFLKDQLNPHFLFNSLNILTNTVYEDPDKAAHYIRQLSRFYRYVLEVQDEEVVPLEREMEFTQRYFELQKNRFGEALQLELSLHGSQEILIPPLVLQLLMENAIKHNAISEDSPLKIEVTQKSGSLIVRNNCNPKSQVEEGTGTGLNNIRERYKILSDEEVEVLHDDNFFEVRLPNLRVE